MIRTMLQGHPASPSGLEQTVRKRLGATYKRRIQRTSVTLLLPSPLHAAWGSLSVHAMTSSTLALPERELWKWGLGPFLSLEDDVKRKNVGSSGLRTTDSEGVMSSALLKPNFISGTAWLGDGDGLEKADFSFLSSLTPFFVSGTGLGLNAVPMLSDKAGSSVVKELRGSPVSASGDTL